MNYRINFNFAVSNTDTITKAWIDITGPLDVGQAMGVMGLSYSVLKYANATLMITNTQGQDIGIVLNAF